LSEPSAADPAPAASPARRRPWVAFLVSLLWPGLGQLYAAKPLRAAIMAVIGLALIGAQGLYLYLVPLSSPEGAVIDMALLIAGLAFSVYCAADARRLASRTPHVTLTRYNRAWIYIAVAALFVAVLAAVSLTGDGIYTSDIKVE
jgi:hypothetical protein